MGGRGHRQEGQDGLVGVPGGDMLKGFHSEAHSVQA